MMLQGSTPGAAAEWNRTIQVILPEGKVSLVVIAAQVEMCVCVGGGEGGGERVLTFVTLHNSRWKIGRYQSIAILINSSGHCWLSL